MQNKKLITKKFGADVSPNSVPFSVRATQQVSTHYICDVFDVLQNLTDVEETMFALGIAEPQDQVTIRLNCQGGSHVVGDALIMAMRNCAAPIHVQASGVVASYATFILLQADSFEISPFVDVLCHSASFGHGGKMSETRQVIDFQYRQAEKMIRHYYEGFFTPEEIDKIINGYEWYMDCDEFLSRFEKRNEYMQTMLEQQECECGHCDIDEEPVEMGEESKALLQEMLEDGRAFIDDTIQPQDITPKRVRRKPTGAKE